MQRPPHGRAISTISQLSRPKLASFRLDDIPLSQIGTLLLTPVAQLPFSWTSASMSLLPRLVPLITSFSSFSSLLRRPRRPTLSQSTLDSTRSETPLQLIYCSHVLTGPPLKPRKYLLWTQSWPTLTQRSRRFAPAGARSTGSHTARPLLSPLVASLLPPASLRQRLIRSWLTHITSQTCKDSPIAFQDSLFPPLTSDSHGRAKTLASRP